MTSRVLRKIDMNPLELTLSPNNVRKDVNEKALEQLTISVVFFNEVLEPIIINTKNQIVAGQRRWLAAKNANLTSIPCIVKEYDSDKDEIIDSLVENELQRDLGSRDKGKAVVRLHEEDNMTFVEMATALGRAESTVHGWYKEATGPEPLRPKDIKKELDKIKAKEKEEKAKKDKEKKEHPSIQEVVEKSEEEIKKEESRKTAKSIYDTFGLRTANVVRRIVESPQFKNDIHKILKFIEYSRDYLKLHDIEDMFKDIKKGLPVDLEHRREIAENPGDYAFRTIRVRKTLLAKMRVIMKRRNIDWLIAVDEAFRDWEKKWSLEEDWEHDRKKKELNL